MENTIHSIRDILGPEGMLAKSIDDFEFRSSQVDMAFLVERALRDKEPAIVEAGTGTGKTLGYLVPIVLSGKKTVISTGTKNLQEQIFFKDLPLLRKATGLKADAMIMKGRKNYLCLCRYRQHFSQSSMIRKEPGKIKDRIERWLPHTEFADLAELEWLSEHDNLWDALSSDSDQCLGLKCPVLDDCFLSKLRSRAAGCSIIIVNHYLFFADLKVKEGGFGEIIPRFQAAVFDEAHKIEEIATTYLGESISSRQFSDLASDLEKFSKIPGSSKKSLMKKHINQLTNGLENLKLFFQSRESRGRLDTETLKSLGDGPARSISNSLEKILRVLETDYPDHSERQVLTDRTEELKGKLEQILIQRDSDWLNWYEIRKKSLALFSSPLNISNILKELLYANIESVVFTSATLSTNNSFDYIRFRLGLPSDSIEGLFPSHFDYKNRTLLYLPEDLPLPSAPDFPNAIAERIEDILERSMGRALILFTSYHNMDIVHSLLEGKLPFTLLKQGDAPRSVLLNEFREDINSILLATGSFWQGVDVPGEALSCLVIDKLPFDSPREPLVAARIDAIRNDGRNSFMEYQVPSAIISFKQGLGRLIRKRSDRGCLSILDIRILNSRYGHYFIKSLPAIPITHKIPDITKFFKKLPESES
ncbi:ATP-dependent DNA helicase [Thermodesulfobacteriota bacterium]